MTATAPLHIAIHDLRDRIDRLEARVRDLEMLAVRPHERLDALERGVAELTQIIIVENKRGAANG